MGPDGAVHGKPPRLTSTFRADKPRFCAVCRELILSWLHIRNPKYTQVLLSYVLVASRSLDIASSRSRLAGCVHWRAQRGTAWVVGSGACLITSCRDDHCAYVGFFTCSDVCDPCKVVFWVPLHLRNRSVARHQVRSCRRAPLWRRRVQYWS